MVESVIVREESGTVMVESVIKRVESINYRVESVIIRVESINSRVESVIIKVELVIKGRNQSRKRMKVNVQVFGFDQNTQIFF